MPRRSMRLDLRGFQRQRVAGAVVITVAVFAALLAAYLAHREAGIARYYLQTSGNEISSAELFFKIISESKKPVAVMFESHTCPVCKAMYPYWAVLEKQSKNLPIDFYHMYFSQATAKAFMEYGVEETPTFIVFVNGKPVGRHVGSFQGTGANISDTMLSWALAAASTAAAPKTPKDYAEEGLRIFNTRCASCHGVIKSLTRQGLEEWLRNGAKTTTNNLGVAAFPALAKLVEKAVEEGKYLHELYPNGFDGLKAAVRDMRRYVPDLLAHEIQRTAYMLDYATAVLEGREPPVFPWMKLANTTVAQQAATSTGQASRLEEAAAAAGAESGVGLVAALAALASGVIAVFSPCVLPLLITHVSVVATSGRRLSAAKCMGCGLAAAAGIIGVGALLLVAGGVVSSIQEVLLPAVAVAVLAAGLASMLGVPVELQGLVSSKRGGLLGFCALYGFLALQCNLPIVAGALLLVAGLGLSLGGLAVVLALALGVGVPLAALTWVVSRGGRAVADKLLEKNELLTRVGGVFLALAGLYLLLSSLQLV